jgi:hypothetical protein
MEHQNHGRWMLYTERSGVDDNGPWSEQSSSRWNSRSRALASARDVRRKGGKARVVRWRRGRFFREWTGRYL